MSNLTFADTCGIPLSSYGLLLASVICNRLEITPDEVKTVSQFDAACAYLKAIHPDDDPDFDEAADVHPQQFKPDQSHE